MILLSFLFAILLGALLLSLPISSAKGEPTSFVDALFTATTATCVTGLVVVPTFSAWSAFGQAVILVLIQIGGLGIITVIAGISLLLNRKMGLSDSMLLMDAFNLNSFSGMGRFVKKVILGSLAVEGAGALLYMTVFIPEFGLKGIWISVFNAVSAFCNAGMDIIGENSLCGYVENPLVNLVTVSLIVLGGLGYIVWWDVFRVVRERKVRKGRLFSRLTLHSKIAIIATIVLIFAPALLFFLFEYSNGGTMGELSLGGKLLASLFQSVTTRTAGFVTVSQAALTNASSVISMLLMFIGGSPVGTAGGIKTVTLVVLIVVASRTIQNKGEPALMGRRLSSEAVAKAVSVTLMSVGIVFISTVLLSLVTDAPLIDLMYETVSAAATVGLSRDLTPTLSTLGKLIISLTMYLGRVGPISLAVAFSVKHRAKNIITDPVEEISVG